MPDSQINYNDQIVIAALVRESSVAENYIQISMSDEVISGLVINLKEEGSGRKVILKTFTVRSFLNPERTNLEQEMLTTQTARIQALDAVYEIGVKLIAFQDQDYTFEVIGPLSKEDRRKKYRSSLEHSFESPILLETQKGNYLGMTRVFDFSFGSLGVEIRTLTELDENDEYKATGTLSVNGHLILIEHAPVRRLHVLKGREEGKVFCYSAGIVFNNQVKKRAGQRLSQRVAPDGLVILVNSCLVPHFEIGITVLDMATSGFKGVFKKKQDRRLLWTGCGLRLHGTDLRGTVVYADEDSIRVEWYLDGGSGEKHWTDLVSGARNPGSDLSLSSAEDLMTSFIRSGTASKGYLSHLPLLLDNTIKGLSNESKYPDWFFKWIERDEKGKTKGHIAGYRLADNLWCAGDLFSDPDQNIKISPGFSKKFLDHFVDFLQRKTPVPKVYGAWKQNHPYWVKTESYLNQNPDVLFSDLLGTTHFINLSRIINNVSDFKFQEIIDADRNQMSHVSDRLRNNGLMGFASAFDFDEDRFASPRTREQFAFRNFIFRRRYFLVSSEKFEGLVVTSRFPYGVSPYNNTSIIFVLPLSSSAEEFSESTSEQIAILAAKIGIYPHRVTYVFPRSHSTNEKKAQNRIVIVQPRMWLNL